MAAHFFGEPIKNSLKIKETVKYRDGGNWNCKICKLIHEAGHLDWFNLIETSVRYITDISFFSLKLGNCFFFFLLIMGENLVTAFVAWAMAKSIQ